MEHEMEVLMVRFEQFNWSSQIVTYRSKCIGGKNKTHVEVDCEDDFGLCEIVGLEPAVRYNISIIACCDGNGADICSESSRSLRC